MTTDSKTWRVRISLPGGEPIVDLMVEALAAQPEAQVNSMPSRPAPVQGGNGEARMTDPQKRFLFRLLGAQGVQGKEAEAHLKQYFKVGNLSDIPKATASDYINQLAKDRREANGT